MGRKMDLRVDRKSFRSTVYMVKERGERDRERRGGQTFELFLF